VNYSRIPADASLPDIEAEIRYWRTRARLTVLPDIRAEIDDDVDELVAMANERARYARGLTHGAG